MMTSVRYVKTCGAVLLAMSSACVVREGRYADAPPPPPPAAAAAPAPAPAPAPAAAPAATPAPGKHPFYLHAIADLRNARANLERKGGDKQMKWDEHDAIVAIDHALKDIKEAAIDDGKNIEEHEPVDAHEPRVGRLHKALAALKSARADIEKEEDNASVNGLRARALHDIDEALRFTEAGVQAAAQAS